MRLWCRVVLITNRKSWMRASWLHLNARKMQVLWLGSRCHVHNLQLLTSTVGVFWSLARDLDVVIDSRLTYMMHTTTRRASHSDLLHLCRGRCPHGRPQDFFFGGGVTFVLRKSWRPISVVWSSPRPHTYLTFFLKQLTTCFTRRPQNTANNNNNVHSVRLIHARVAPQWTLSVSMRCHARKTRAEYNAMLGSMTWSTAP